LHHHPPFFKQWWLKLEPGGRRPVTPLESMHRHPFEAVLLLVPELESEAHHQHDTAANSARRQKPHQYDAVDGLVFMSVPAAEHSRKPNLSPLIDAYLPLNHQGDKGGGRPRRLELFARELHAGWDSAGNEALMFQNLSLFSQK